MQRLTARRVISGAAIALVAGLVPGFALTPANADTDSTLTVVGTSDVWDSNLMQTAIIPNFEAWYQQQHGTAITLNYIHTGTGQAIAQAEAGTASGLLVHAASLENQFVGDGYSLEKWGRAIFWGDYVLLGPSSDPAGVMTGNSKEDIVQAFQKIAAAGADGHADFVSRGGNPGTTIAEHAIWALTSGVPTCTVPDVDGGGTVPSSISGDCPTLASALPFDFPSWYHATGATQALNIENADTCSYAGSNPNDCYVFTDRGTFDYLESTNALTNMGLVVNDNDLAPAAQANLLVNSFHLYGVNPDKFSGSTAAGINTSAMTDLLNWLTSPEAQADVAAYLQSGGDEPFRPSASPAITSSALPKKVSASKPVILQGTVKNVVPGTPALNGVKVSVEATDKGKTTTLASAKTGNKGKFSLSFVPTSSSATYRLVTPKITKIENDQLSPPFGDTLQPSTLSLGTTTVKGAVSISKATAASKTKAEVKGSVLPTVTRKAGQLQLWAAHPGGTLKEKGHKKLAVGTKKFDETFKLGKGTWVVQVKYVNSGVIDSATSARQRVTLG